MWGNKAQTKNMTRIEIRAFHKTMAPRGCVCGRELWTVAARGRSSARNRSKIPEINILSDNDRQGEKRRGQRELGYMRH